MRWGEIRWDESVDLFGSHFCIYTPVMMMITCMIMMVKIIMMMNKTNTIKVINKRTLWLEQASKQNRQIPQKHGIMILFCTHSWVIIDNEWMSTQNYLQNCKQLHQHVITYHITVCRLIDFIMFAVILSYYEKYYLFCSFAWSN